VGESGLLLQEVGHGQGTKDCSLVPVRPMPEILGQTHTRSAVILFMISRTYRAHRHVASQAYLLILRNAGQMWLSDDDKEAIAEASHLMAEHIGKLEAYRELIEEANKSENPDQEFIKTTSSKIYAVMMEDTEVTVRFLRSYRLSRAANLADEEYLRLRQLYDKFLKDPSSHSKWGTWIKQYERLLLATHLATNMLADIADLTDEAKQHGARDKVVDDALDVLRGKSDEEGPTP